MQRVGLAVVVFGSAMLFLSACRGTDPAAPQRRVVRIISSPQADQYSSAPFADQLAREYSRLLPNLEVKAYRGAAVSALASSQADIAILPADNAYQLYWNTPDGARANGTHLRALATLQAAPMHLLAGAKSQVRSVTDLRHHVLGLADDDLIVDLVLNAAGVAGDVIRKGPYNRADLASGLSRGDFDAVFARNMYPAAFVQTAIHQGARLISIDGPRIDGLPSDYPFLQRVSIPPGVYVGQTERVRTIAVDVILVCRADLDEELAHELTEYLFRAVSRVPAYHDALQFIEIHEASATPIPLHDGAARYYRELELFR